jgi:hypothetical protein
MRGRRGGRVLRNLNLNYDLSRGLTRWSLLLNGDGRELGDS